MRFCLISTNEVLGPTGPRVQQTTSSAIQKGKKPGCVECFPAVNFTLCTHFQDVVRSEYVGPTEESNWLIKGRVLVGAYPCADDDEYTDAILHGILRLGISTFVCLQSEYDHSAQE